MSDRKFFVSLGDSVSRTFDVEYGVPQGSILGPILFSSYMLPLSKLISFHNVHYHCYADDIQLYISVSSEDPSVLNNLFCCLTDINIWMNKIFLKLNEQKTEILLVGSLEDRQKLQSKFGSLSQQIKSHVTSQGVILDFDLNFIHHFNNVAKTSFFHLRNIAKIRPFLSQDDAETLVHVFITSHLDYCNSLFTGLPRNSLKKLQVIQNAAARILTNTKKEIILVVPKVTHKKTGEAAFCFNGSKLWNTLPLDLRIADSLAIF